MSHGPGIRAKERKMVLAELERVETELVGKGAERLAALLRRAKDAIQGAEIDIRELSESLERWQKIALEQMDEQPPDLT